MEVAVLKEETQNFIKACHTIYGRDPSDMEIKDHLALETQPENVN